MNKLYKQKEKIWIAIFMAILVAASPTYFFTQKYLNNENLEKRAVAEKPELTMDNFGDYPEEYEAYYNDHLPYRNQLIALNNRLDFFAFNRSASEKVTIGKDGWLFYSSDEDVNALETSLGYYTFTGEELEQIAHNLTDTQNVLDSLKMDFVFFIAPNKETIYRDMIPECFRQVTDETALKQLVEYLRANTDIPVVYPGDELRQVKEAGEHLPYLKLDTHWNYLGAYVGSCKLLEELGVDMPGIDEITINTKPYNQGDLSRILNVYVENGETLYGVDGYSTNEVEEIEADDQGISRYACPEGIDERILVRHDSFGAIMREYVASQFNKTCFEHQNVFASQDLVDFDADIFVLESVERYIQKLKDFRISYVDIQSFEEAGVKNIQMIPGIEPDLDEDDIEEGKQPVIDVIIRHGDGSEEVLYQQSVIPADIIATVPADETGEVLVTVYCYAWGDEPVETITYKY